MKNGCRWAGIIALSVAPALGAASAPAGWFKAGTAPQSYETGVAAAGHAGKRSAFLRSAAPVPQGFGTLMQTVEAESYAGRRVRLSAFVKADGVKRWAGLWMRVDGPYGKVLAFDNMEKRPITGSSDWRRCEVVLDVPKAAQQISFGILLEGEGGVLLDHVRIEKVSPDVPTTAPPVAQSALPQPANLDFEE
jgi:hypothetical protein